jgi:hypothetical protein
MLLVPALSLSWQLRKSVLQIRLHHVTVKEDYEFWGDGGKQLSANARG